MNMLAFDPIRAESHDFLRVLQYFQNCIKMSETVVRLGVRERDIKQYNTKLKN